MRFTGIELEIFEPERIISKAERSFQSQPVHLTDFKAPMSPGGRMITIPTGITGGLILILRTGSRISTVTERLIPQISTGTG